MPLKECHAWTREGCNHCPDFAAEHADISTGGIGKYNDWTLTIVRTELGREIMSGMLVARRIETRPGDDDPGGDRAHAQAGRARAASAGRSPPSSLRAGCRRSRPRTDARLSLAQPGVAVDELAAGEVGVAVDPVQLSTMLASSAGNGPGLSASSLLHFLNGQNGIVLDDLVVDAVADLARG